MAMSQSSQDPPPESLRESGNSTGPFDAATKDPKAQLQAILKGGGGLGLAFKLMKSSLLQHVKIKYVAEQSSWCWYTDEIENTKSPKDAFAYSLRLADGGWQSDDHLWKILEPLRTAAQLRFMGIPLGESTWATKSLLYFWHIHMRRSWSLSRHSAPPEDLAGLLAPIAATRARRARRLEVEYRHVLLLERRAHSLDEAARLRKDIIFLDSTAVRIVFEFYARDKYAPTSRSGQNAVMAHLWSAADNKIVEDIHQPLRLNARANVNDVILRSEVLGGGRGTLPPPGGA